MNEQSYSHTPPSVLMVDDTPANLELLSGMLKVKGYRVRAAVSGKLALQAARNDPPDLILLDINMPVMNGYAVCAELKADVKLKEIPVIFLSALNETIDKVKAFAAGGVDYITKPFQFEEVESRVEAHLELRRQKKQLQENFTRLSELEKLRDNLVHMLIHDLRSPLTVIAGYHQLIREDAGNTLSADSTRYISEAIKSSELIVDMVNDVLDTSKMEEGQMKLKVAECDLADALKASLTWIKPLSENRRMRYRPSEGPVKVLADRDLIQRVIHNLLMNAIRFTSKDSGSIQLGAGASGGRVRVTVKDNGPGVAPENRAKIFEKFSQVDLGAAHQRNSTGLGLTFCKLAVEAHGGSIGVDGETGKGSSFWFELPLNGPGPSGA